MCGGVQRTEYLLTAHEPCVTVAFPPHLEVRDAIKSSSSAGL